MSARRLLVMSVAVALTGLAAAPRAARACVPLSCTPLQAAPDRGDVPVPASVPALALWPDKAPDAADDPEPGELVLMTEAGAPVAAAVMPDPTLAGAFLLVPAAPLEAGQGYTLTYATSCGGNAPSPRQNAVATGPASALPSVIGEVTTTAQTAEINEYEIPPCTGKALAAQITIGLSPSEELRPWLPVTRFTTVVDGEVWVESFYGQSQGRLGRARRHHDQLFAVCDPASATELTDLGLSPGMHDVELRAHVAGADSDPEPVRFTVELRCDEPTGDGGPADAGPGDGGAGADAAGGGDTPAGGGCAVAGPAGARAAEGVPLAWLALLALLALGLARWASPDGTC